MGDDLLSHGVYPAVPSALAGLTSLFGMGRGVSPPPSSPFLKSGKYSVVRPAERLAFENRIARSVKDHQALDLLVPLGYIHRCTYTCGLSTWWSTRSLTPSKGMGDLISRRASRLDAFSGYPFRT